MQTVTMGKMKIKYVNKVLTDREHFVPCKFLKANFVKSDKLLHICTNKEQPIDYVSLNLLPNETFSNLSPPQKKKGGSKQGNTSIKD